MDRLSRDGILRALSALSDELARASARAELALAGGAALVLLFAARESTQDLDAFVLDGSAPADVAAAARRVSEALGWPADWLNDAAKQPLAMKLSAWRDDVDVEDARLLLRTLHGSRDEVWRQVEPHVVPGRELKARYAFDDLWEADHGAS